MNPNWYFVRLFHQSKFLFAVVTILFALHLNANFFYGGQQSPFFLWNLYAAPIPAKSEHSFYEVQFNGNKILKLKHTWEQTGAYIMMNQLTYYMYMLEHGSGPLDQFITHWNSNHPTMGNLLPGLQFYPDSTQMKLFPQWFHRKLEQYLHEQVHEITILKTTVRFLPNGKVQLLSSIPVCKLK